MTSTTSRTAQEVITALNLVPHPEKGYFVETFRDAHLSSDKRSYGTCIYYLLEGESGLSHWHRVLDATEVWHYYAGAPLRLSLSWDDGKPVRDVVLGNDLWNVSQHDASSYTCTLTPLAYPKLGAKTTGRRRCRRMAACAQPR